MSNAQAQAVLNTAQTNTITQLANGAYPTELAKQLYFLAYAEKIIETAEGVIEDGATETTVASILSALPSALGQQNKAGSLSVVIASDQDAITTNLGSIGAVATEATVADIETAIGNTATAGTVLNLLQEIFDKDSSTDTTGLSTEAKQDSLISTVANLATQSPNISTPIQRSVTHAVYKDLDNDGFDDSDGTSPASVTIAAGKRFIGWFIRSGFPTINGITWYPQEEENLRPGTGETLGSITVDFTNSEVLISYY